MPGELDMLPDEESDIKPDVEEEEDDVKPDLDSDCPGDDHYEDAKPDIKPDVDEEDLKPVVTPDIKPHPAAIAYGILERSVTMMDSWLKRHPSKEGQAPKPKGRVLVLVGTYSIGKERIVKGE